MDFGEYLRALITADSEMERADKWGFREAFMRSFRRREIFPDNVRFMTEDAVRWESPEASLTIPDLAFGKLHFDGDPGRPASAHEMIRQATALGRFVTDSARAHHFRLIPPDTPRPKGVLQASPPRVESVRVARRATPDNRVLFDLIAEVTQSCTVTVAGDTFDMDGGCTLVIGPHGEIRYVIAKGFANADRHKRQHAALNGPLRDFWEKSGRRFKRKPNVLQRVHAAN
jgi:hypothetical protein